MRLLITLAFFLSASHCMAEIKTAEDFGNWMTRYYQNPDPSSISDAIKKGAELKMLGDPQKVGPPVFGFIAGAVKDNPDLARKLVSELRSLDEQQYGLILVGIWYADLPNNESMKIVSQELNSYANLKAKYAFLLSVPVNILSVSPKQGPWVLDAMWGYFFATGSSEPVINIISILPWIDESKKNEVIAMGKPGMYLLATSGSAKWSLTSNSRQHKRVLDICEDQIPKQPEIISKQLKEIVSNASQHDNTMYNKRL